MGCPNRRESDQADPCVSDALLIATMCIIGLPVDVHVRDGSVYSGIFHTAYGDKEYGVVLKQAKLTKKGNCNVNVSVGSMVETLIIFSSDLVQVVAKGVLHPAEGINCKLTDCNVEAAVTNGSSEVSVKEAKQSEIFSGDRQITEQSRQIGDVLALVPEGQCKQKLGCQGKKSGDEIQCSATALGSFHTEVRPLEGGYLSTKILPNGGCLEPTPALDPVSRHNSLTTSSDVPSPQSSESSKSSKEFKLNPGAKIFCPSFASSASAPSPAVPALGGMAYMPSSSPILPIPAPQPEVSIGPFAPRPSVPAKISPFSNLIAGNGGNNSQFSHPIVGHMGSRTPPLRYAGQYHTIPTGPAYVPPNSPPLMVGRLGQQLVYVQPVAHDLLQSTGGMSQMPVRPLIGPHQVQYPKHQGNAVVSGQGMPICMPPPFVGGGVQQPFTMPGHIPLLPPPIPANRHIPVPSSNALFATKFP
ncbi:unnamed protein product [Linum tenue]|uniref:Ataxin 2 SM domain-containing protein n=1 Tax=Linum tenue TaxID=586396 RepID=A0AAV0LRK2_9ROSI|nr:unnamed protein product [Linum tenue]